MTLRIGFGYDSHQFGADRDLVLAGVRIEHDSGLRGHSDGDAVAHAVIDALLGAAAMGDIGTLFPDSDPQWKDANSMALIRDVKSRLRAAGYFVGNLDVTIITEAPRIAPYVTEMREKLADVLAVARGAVSVKAKTNESMDDVGAGKGLIVHAVASLGEF